MRNARVRIGGLVAGACWEATYSSSLANGPDHFKARVD